MDSSRLLVELRCELESALSKLGEAGSQSKHDPSWIRPMHIPVSEVREACIQAYHHIHKALELLDNP